MHSTQSLEPFAAGGSALLPEPSRPGPESRLLACELTIGESRCRAAVSFEQIDQIDLARILIGSRAVMVGDFVTGCDHRLPAIVGRRARRLAVVAPARVERAELIDHVIDPRIILILQAGRARLRQQLRPGGRSLLRERANIRQGQTLTWRRIGCAFRDADRNIHRAAHVRHGGGDRRIARRENRDHA